MGYSSNIDDVIGSLDALGQTFHLRRKLAGGKRVGDGLLEIAAAAVEDRTLNQKLEPDLSPLAPLRPSTIKRKLRKGFPAEIGVETGKMLDMGQIEGRTHVGDDTAAMEYGLDEEERLKAEHFQEGRPGVQAGRPFYELGKDGERRVDDFVEEVAEQARRDFEG